MDKQNDKEKIKQQIRDIENLARRLPWILAILSLIAFIAIVIQVLFF